ncbi:MAG: sigma-54-dependent Fis family transcriptional regulator [Myxococcales bacterium]|nr:sigma-54-dependent Fis family transcriptional regulator [Myxococcales bacterium]
MTSAGDVSEIIGRSKPMQDILRLVERVAPFKSTVLIGGESGTGKEIIARAIHDKSPRRSEPFVAVNCGAIPENLIEAELFGHVKGAYTGAVATREGFFEKAQKGTLFLDEIGDLPLSLQVKILRALQEEEIVRVGDRRPIKLDIRFIAATNRNLDQDVHEGRFRADLFYRLNVVSIQVPPLRERLDDLPLFVHHFVQSICRRLGKRLEGVSREAIGMMRNYEWPGNIRELENVLEQTILMMDDDQLLEPRHLPLFMERRGAERRRRMWEEALDRKLSLDEYAREFVVRFQEQHTEKELANFLGITPKTLWEKRKKWGLPRTRH